ncbi:MAG: carboxypeptidase regulatory-like domain-containing protein, partial [Gemmatimonadetes bacterium]|nr:carboxypeptidase regulatory-like domain-containing protein [Gemmatimonadota bacterium]
MTLRRLLVLLSFPIVSVAARPVHAQQADVIRGRVIGVDSQAIEGVRVTVTSLSGAVNRQARTDKNGRFTVTFQNGEGDYFVSFSAIGYAVKRFEVKRTADEDILVADAKLSRTQDLDAMRITAPRDRVDRNSVNADVSGTEKQVNANALTADQLGDLASMAASIPGITLVPGSDGDPSGFSALGLSPDQNNTTLNGAQFGGANLPRDAAITSSLVTSPYDVSRGGFSGGQFSISTRGGSNYIVRSSSLNVDAPQMQWTDPAGRALGQQYSNLSLGGLLGGPVKLDESSYMFSYQLGRRANDLQTLLNTDPLGLQTTGIAADSVARLRAILGGLRVPTTVSGIPSERLADNGLVLGTYNVAPASSKSGTALTVTYQGSWSNQSPATSSLTSEFPAHSGDRTNWSGFVSARHSTYFGFGILSETQLSVNQSRNWGTPYLAMPNGNVLVNSAFPDGTNGVKFVSFGGNPSLGVSSRNGSVAFSNLLSWFSENNKHRIKLSTELRRDGYTQDQTTNLLGTFSFNSLADLQAGRPAMFTRQLTPRQRTGAQFVGAIALGDSYKASKDLQVQYGVRLDGNQYEGAPARNPQLEQLFGVRNDHVPNQVYASPRVGFSWAYGTAPQIGGFEGAMRGPRAVVRGGVGMFQNTPGTTLLGNAIDNTGLPGAVQQVSCYGPAAPTPDWNG